MKLELLLAGASLLSMLHTVQGRVVNVSQQRLVTASATAAPTVTRSTTAAGPWE